jgi:catechol 2,3-dioxygenase-like lactoylglutathione lyase family enzyme
MADSIATLPLMSVYQDNYSRERVILNKLRKMILAGMVGLLIAGWSVNVVVAQSSGGKPMELGAFSVSLAVKDIAISRTFYENLGFVVTGGNQEQNWLILKNGTTIIGLFQGMFEENILTFNPGWNSAAQELEAFVDVRELQGNLEASDIEFKSKADPESKGPASFVIVDPDGNTILFDQHR